ncbi:MAG: glutamine--fructose-6-phosphate transaminase (isomerizing) [Oscillospiraceae bacterium]|jgi:glucosamine--fructose-6-phosphate aminotransferase (isomerizing)|nr:glutamine--fructose-6-phosphate transaminase (isomerizing) [Oscillospiraceae bacterium]
MCGIAGYVGSRVVRDILIAQLKKMEYRGYDSAGLAVVGGGGIHAVKVVGHVSALEQESINQWLPGNCGIGHTRWATNGRPSTKNAHPHTTSKVAVVHNGIIENSDELKVFLESNGYSFEGETDTEAVAKLLDFYYDGDPMIALNKVAKRLKGSFALGILFFDATDAIYALKKGGPLIIGLCAGENFLSSDINAVLEYTTRYYVLEDDEIAIIKKDHVEVFDAQGVQLSKTENVADWKADLIDKQGFSHFMRKEIFEQPQVVTNIILENIRDGIPDFEAAGVSDEYLKRFKRICIVGCGTARYAGLVGKNWIEHFARLPVDVVMASEFRYQNPVLFADTLVVLISQSGETADTLAAARLVKDRGISSVGIVNVKGSNICREVEHVIFTQAGVEVAVASTKAYIAQLSVLFLLSLKLGFVNGQLAQDRIHSLCNQFIDLPEILRQVLREKEAEIQKLAQACVEYESIFFLGRGLDYLLALEGALKLKEVSYVNAQAYAAGELKHGPISLITDRLLVIALVTQEAVKEKIINNLREVTARCGKVRLLFKAGMQIPADLIEQSLQLPALEDFLMPFLVAETLQLLAYYSACAVNANVDKPRNLAKSVTVE